MHRLLVGFFAVFICSAQAPPPGITEYVRAPGRVIAKIGNAYSVFTDVSQFAPYADAVNMMYANGITKGCGVSPRAFCPDPASGGNGYLYRYQMAVFVIRAWSIRLWGDPEAFKQNAPPSPTPYFVDAQPFPVNAPVQDSGSNFVSQNVANAFPYIQKMWELGFTLGCVAGPDNQTRKFCPGNLPPPLDTFWRASHYQIAVFSVRGRIASDARCTANCRNDNFSFTPTPFYLDVPSSDPNFKFIQKATDYGAVIPAVGTLGCSSGRFCPNNDSYRGQMAEFVVRIILGEPSF